MVTSAKPSLKRQIDAFHEEDGIMYAVHNELIHQHDFCKSCDSMVYVKIEPRSDDRDYRCFKCTRCVRHFSIRTGLVLVMSNYICTIMNVLYNLKFPCFPAM